MIQPSLCPDCGSSQVSPIEGRRMMTCAHCRLSWWIPPPPPTEAQLKAQDAMYLKLAIEKADAPQPSRPVYESPKPPLRPFHEDKGRSTE